ncbi:hypothetical protein RhiirA4_484715 [Rhizophagus irregularis]|uniref:Uncharacterized protein n=1 Tax=Rhizophagus irregularis TaxID=588596 RepID=A0A2I1HPA0_9GLOM|nr:hypothetical protein RhiirA4_484715 [Rhizophagus irregularis]
MMLKNPRNLNYVTSINFNRIVHKRRRRRIVNRKYRNAFNINTLSRLPLQITNDPFAYIICYGYYDQCNKNKYK